jgi:hypothetical protein
MSPVSTLRRGDRPGFYDLVDIQISPEGSRLHLRFEEGTSNTGITFGFHDDPDAYFEMPEFDELEGEFLRLEVYPREWVHEYTTARVEYIIVTDKGRYPICIMKHQSDDDSGVSHWAHNPNWESILW